MTNEITDYGNFKFVFYTPMKLNSHASNLKIQYFYWCPKWLLLISQMIIIISLMLGFFINYNE